ncbi:hypothetical protein FGIG_08622 [Fasciola gigantica]|uniref:Trafficking protein particle complex subunit 13 n=1 Tax=Fasciola gigantica TaxID=46835 RepID=A0A504YJ88_FASGI|nr:hypothetical protein FGIG_08622 [Fasciola gigantica]
MNLHNESDQICYNVDLKVTLHNSIEWINLSTTGTLTGASIPAMSACSPEIASRTSTTTGSVDLHPGQSLNAVIHYELKELGAHTLRCTASYCMHAQSQSTTSTVQAVSTGMKGGLHADQSGLETYTFQRLYRFTVIKPLDVKKKFSLVDLDGTVFMEAQVQNLTTAPIFLERVAFEPSPHLTVVDLNVTDRNQQFPLKTMPACLRPEDVRQFLFRLTPTASLLQLHTVKSITSDASRTTSAPLRPMGPQPSQPIQQPPISAGRLDITWRETMGERGRLQTSSLKYEIPNTADIQVKPIEIPSTVTVEKPFEIRIELSNRRRETATFDEFTVFCGALNFWGAKKPKSGALYFFLSFCG